MSRPFDTAALREAWRHAGDALPRADDCPPPERIWDAAHGRLEPGPTRDVVEHLARCPACAKAWRLALEAEDVAIGVPQPLPARRRWRPAAMALAAVLALALGWRFMAPGGRGDGGTPTERGAELGIESLIADDEVLGRDDFVLAWQGGPAGARYHLLVTTASLEVVERIEGLSAPRYRVAREKLAGLEAGTVLLWRVEATLPDGQRATSPAFRVHLR